MQSSLRGDRIFSHVAKEKRAQKRIELSHIVMGESWFVQVNIFE